MNQASTQRVYSLGSQVCSIALGLLGLFWAGVMVYWIANCFRGGIDAARAWLMHVALLGVPFEQRSMAETIQRIHATYEHLIGLLLLTFAIYAVRNVLRSRECRSNAGAAGNR